MTNTPWMNLLETAQYMRISERHLRDLRDAGKLPHGRTGKKYVFHKDEVDAYMRDQGGTATSRDPGI